jgi:hypothetical protein
MYMIFPPSSPSYTLSPHPPHSHWYPPSRQDHFKTNNTYLLLGKRIYIMVKFLQISCMKRKSLRSGCGVNEYIQLMKVKLQSRKVIATHDFCSADTHLHSISGNYTLLCPEELSCSHPESCPGETDLAQRGNLKERTKTSWFGFNLHSGSGLTGNPDRANENQ